MSSEAWNPDRIKQENLVLEPGTETVETGEVRRQKQLKAPIGLEPEAASADSKRSHQQSSARLKDKRAIEHEKEAANGHHS